MWSEQCFVLLPLFCETLNISLKNANSMKVATVAMRLHFRGRLQDEHVVTVDACSWRFCLMWISSTSSTRVVVNLHDTECLFSLKKAYVAQTGNVIMISFLAWAYEDGNCETATDHPSTLWLFIKKTLAYARFVICIQDMVFVVRCCDPQPGLPVFRRSYDFCFHQWKLLLCRHRHLHHMSETWAWAPAADRKVQPALSANRRY